MSHLVFARCSSIKFDDRNPAQSAHDIFLGDLFRLPTPACHRCMTIFRREYFRLLLPRVGLPPQAWHRHQRGEYAPYSEQQHFRECIAAKIKRVAIGNYLHVDSRAD